jgi:hypothetical protein
MANIFKFYNGKLEITASTNNNVTIESRKSLDQFVDLFTKLFNSLDVSIGLGLFFKGNKNTILAKKLNNLAKLWETADKKFHIAYGSLAMFAEDLSIIRSSNPECFKKFKWELIKQRSSLSWEGFRFEVRVCASFLKKKITIKNQESPDFIIYYNDQAVYVEATISRVEQQKNKSHLYKVQSAINKKNKKVYANSNTALFVDASNILHHDSQVMEESGFEELIDSISKDKKIKYGAVILFCFLINEYKNRYESCYRRVVFEHCSDNLEMLIDQEYPKGTDYRVEPDISMSC